MPFSDELLFKPVNGALWEDLEFLFGKHGAYSGCWCMWWRIKRSDFTRQQGEGNKRALKEIIDSGTIPGIIAYLHDQPIGWCSVAPREQFSVLDRSPTLKRIDAEPVWSIVCFFIAKQYRWKGLSKLMIRGAVEYAKERGARIVEAYPLDKRESRHIALEAFTGFATTFLKMGFTQAARRSKTRPIMRYYIAER
jgi:GNAT superfamily N-acetyltransferase